MILATHAIAGAAISTVVPQSAMIIFIAAFTSHFLLDAIPHWEYRLGSYIQDQKNPLNSDIVLNKKFALDLLKIGADFSAGIIVSMIFFQNPQEPLQWNILVGMIGGVAPDFLQFAYWKLRTEPLKTLQKFHILIHAKTKLNDKPVLGIALQIILVAAILYVTS